MSSQIRLEPCLRPARPDVLRFVFALCVLRAVRVLCAAKGNAYVTTEVASFYKHKMLRKYCSAPCAEESATARASKTLCTDRPLLRIASSKAFTTASGSRSSACASFRMSSAALLRSTMVLSPAASSSSYGVQKGLRQGLQLEGVENSA